MTDDGHQLDPMTDRHETATERLDRNWRELLQELRSGSRAARL
jgi:hypothetical protein